MEADIYAYRRKKSKNGVGIIHSSTPLHSSLPTLPAASPALSPTNSCCRSYITAYYPFLTVGVSCLIAILDCNLVI